MPVFLTAWGLIAGLPGFANHRSGLHPGAGCQYWKLLNDSGTQRLLAVVNLCFLIITLIGDYFGLGGRLGREIERLKEGEKEREEKCCQE